MIRYLSLEEVLRMHALFIEKFGGLTGIRNNNLLLSALQVPKSKMFGQEIYPSVYDKAAAYLYHLVQNHPFNDGNKRTGFGASLLFLKANNAPILFNDKTFENFVVEVAKGQKNKKEIAYFFKYGHEL